MYQSQRPTTFEHTQQQAINNRVSDPKIRTENSSISSRPSRTFPPTISRRSSHHPPAVSHPPLPQAIRLAVSHTRPGSRQIETELQLHAAKIVGSRFIHAHKKHRRVLSSYRAAFRLRGGRCFARIIQAFRNSLFGSCNRAPPCIFSK